MSISSRHHYLPVFYLNGFTDDKGELHVFNMSEKRMVSKSLSPKSIFFERDRNTLFLETGTTDFIEQVYSLMDNACAKAFEDLRRIKDGEITAEILIKVRFFLSTLFWRMPNFDGKIDSFIDGLDKDELKFRIIDKAGNDAPDEVFQQHLNDPDFRKSYRTSLSLINHRIIRNEEVDNWKFYFAGGNGFHITGDNPIILKNPDAKHIEETDFVVPLSSNSLLVHKNGERKPLIEPETIAKINLLTILQSTRYACCSNRLYVQYISKISMAFDTGRTRQLADEIFELL